SVAFSHDSTRLASASSDRTVKIWDLSSGDCRQTFSVGKVLYSISFSFTDSYLHTDMGTIALQDSIPQSTVLGPCNPRYQCLSVSSDGVWIRYNSDNLLWLPPEYRPSCSAVSRKTIGIGVQSGRVWICNVQLSTT
ncbi:hypothetical protein GQ43DRAFT_290692, partial [Delitschia confertaspora ATCC 74209]